MATALRDRYRPIEVRPINGGQLVTRGSSDNAGLADYVVKRDWYRDLDVEKRREGCDYFWPNLGIGVGGQPFPGQLRIDNITRVGATATAIISLGHHFQSGETLVITGANNAAYNGTFVITVTDSTHFTYTVVGAPPTPDNGASIAGAPIETITMVHLCRQGNDQTCVVAGSQRRLYRYFALTNGNYWSIDPLDYPPFQIPNYVSLNPADYPIGQIAQYVIDNPGYWIVIGWDFSLDGHRWEAIEVAGWTVFNNGVDLPVSYQVNDYQVTPIYELRENGVASVGTIAEYIGALMCMDITEIQSDWIEENFREVGVVSSGEIKAAQTANTVTTVQDYFVVGDVGRTIIYFDGRSANIVGFTNARTVTVDGSAMTVIPQTFTLRTKAHQVGSTFSSPITGSQTLAGFIVTASAPIFALGMVGSKLRYTNGFSGTITGFGDNQHVTLDTAATDNFSGLPFYIIDPTTAFRVSSTASIFTSSMVGLQFAWADGQVRTIVSFIDGLNVQVDDDMPHAFDFIGIQNINSYGVYTQTAKERRIGYRQLWSLSGAPRRFGAVVPGDITALSKVVTLKYPVKSFESGQQIIITGAGTAGGNLTANIVVVSGMGQVLTLDTAAVTTSLNANVIRADTLGSMIGYEDLQNDGAPIVRALGLADALIVYTSTTIFIQQSTGDPNAPFVWYRREIPKETPLYYRWALINVNRTFHLYAGRNAFYTFDLTNQLPLLFSLAEPCKNLFYDNVTLAETDQVFATNNAMTREAWFVFPGTPPIGESPPYNGPDWALCFDYIQNTASTHGFRLTAGEMIDKPLSGQETGPAEEWFIMGTTLGSVVLYGLTNEPQLQTGWNNGKEIYYRRFTNPYSTTQVAYDSTFKSGLSSFGNAYDEKDVRSIVPLMGSQSPNTPLTVVTYSTRNANEGVTTQDTTVLSSPQTDNLIPMLFQDNYFQYSVTVSGVNNPCRISGSIWEVAMVNSKSAIRI